MNKETCTVRRGRLEPANSGGWILYDHHGNNIHCYTRYRDAERGARRRGIRL